MMIISSIVSIRKGFGYNLLPNQECFVEEN